MIETTVKLGELGTKHIWFVSCRVPSGMSVTLDDQWCTDSHLIAERDGRLFVPHEEWWQLEGKVTERTWEWNGVGNPWDFDMDSVLRIVAYLPAEKNERTKNE